MSTDSLIGRTDAREVDPLDLVSPKRYGQSGPPHALWHMMRHHDPAERQMIALGGLADVRVTVQGVAPDSVRIPYNHCDRAARFVIGTRAAAVEAIPRRIA